MSRPKHTIPVVCAMLIASGCSGQGSTGGQVSLGEYQAAPEELRSLGIYSYKLSPGFEQITDDFKVVFLNEDGKIMGEFDQLEDHLQFALNDLSVTIQKGTVYFQSGDQKGVIVLGDSGPSGDPKDMQLWDQTKVVLEHDVTMIAKDLGLLPENNQSSVSRTDPIHTQYQSSSVAPTAPVAPQYWCNWNTTYEEDYPNVLCIDADTKCHDTATYGCRWKHAGCAACWWDTQPWACFRWWESCRYNCYNTQVVGTYCPW